MSDLNKPTGFDLRVQVRDDKTGEVVRHQPYKLRIEKQTRYYERPVGSGNLFYEGGNEAGRWVKLPSGQMGPDTTATHVQWTAPLEGAEKLFSDNEKLKQQYETLRAELEAIQREKEFAKHEDKISKEQGK